MSISQWWMHTLVPDDAFETVRSAFEQAREHEVLPALPALNELEAAVAQNAHARSPEGLALIVRYHASFNLQAYADVGRRLFQGDFGFEVTAESTAGFVTTRNITPVSILYFAVGYEKARPLPGQFGNALIPYGQLDHIKEQFARTFYDRERCIDRASMLYSLDHSPCKEDATDIVDAWPNAIRRAKERRAGLLSIGMKAP
jgi:hypothetical protein